VDLPTLAAHAADTLDGLAAGSRFASPVPRLSVFRSTAPTALTPDLYEPVVCLILQGHKETTFGGSTLHVGPGQALLVSHHMPVSARIVTATPDEPYLSLVLRLDLALLRSLSVEVRDGSDARGPALGAAVQQPDPRMVDALGRYLTMPDDDVERRVMGPLLLRETHFRLLMAPHSGMLRRLLRPDSHASNVQRAIARIRQDYRSPLVVPSLAREVGMSASSFHKHFREITSSTPLQYHKELRLLEARRLLGSGEHTVTNVAYDVGYASPNQFSREYARRFGVPPREHLPSTATG